MFVIIGLEQIVEYIWYDYIMISIYEIDRILKKKIIKIIIFPVVRIIIHSAIMFTCEYVERESWSSAISNASDIFRESG